MSGADAALRVGPHGAAHSIAPLRTGERPDGGHRRAQARLTPALVVGALVEAGLIAGLLAIAAPPRAAPVPLTIAIVTEPPPPPAPPVASPPAVPAAEAPVPPEVPPTPVPPLPDQAPTEDVLALPPDAGMDAPPAPLAELLAAPSRLPAVTPPRPLAHLPPRPVLRPPEPVRRQTRAEPRAAPQTPAVVAAPAAPALPQAAAPAPAPSHAGLESYEGRLRAAIQAALRYPPVAAMMGSNGRARVSFRIRDARPDGIQLVRGTGSPQLDAAALAAVRQAAYPSPPAAIAGRDMAMLVWVEFDRADAEE